MGFAIKLVWDEKTTAAIQSCWSTLAEHGFRHMHDSGYLPHITLAGTGQIDPDSYTTELSKLASSYSKFPLTSPCISFFPSVSPTVFLGITPTRDLMKIHGELLQSLSNWGSDLSVHYSSDRWIPHCTLAFQIPVANLSEALSVCRQNFSFPLSGQATDLALVKIPGGEILWKQKLNP